MLWWWQKVRVQPHQKSSVENYSIEGCLIEYYSYKDVYCAEDGVPLKAGAATKVAVQKSATGPVPKAKVLKIGIGLK
jgi:hypothetical protein